MNCLQSQASPGKLLHAEKSMPSNTHSQTVLIKCLLKQSHAPDIRTSSLKLFNKWLTLQNQNQSGHSGVITQKDIAFIIKEIIKYYDSYESAGNDGKRILVDTTNSIISNPVFQQYFRHHPETYCDIISVSLTNMQDSMDVLNLLKLSSSFFKRTAVDSEFRTYFMKTLFTPLVTSTVRFIHDSDIFTESSYVLERCLVNKTLAPLTDSEDIEVKGEFLTVLATISSFHNRQKLDLAKFSYKLLFQSVCNLHSKNFKSIYNFFVFLVDNLGFNVSEAFHLKNSLKLQNTELSFSLDVLADAINILTNCNCSLDCTVNKLNFSDFLKNILLSVMNLTIFSNLQVYSIIHSIVSINPLIIEQSISNILAYLMINQHLTPEIQHSYENLMVSIFQVFSKLHRIEKLVSVMVRSAKCKLEANCKQPTGSYDFVGKNDVADEAVVALPEVESVLSNAMLQAFSSSIISLLSWQVINIFKTLNFHFNETLEAKEEDEKFHCYVEILSALFCCFLCSVRVAEHTVTSTVQEKFCKALEDLKLTLSKFGEVLLNREHNHVLMRAYLNICFTYGETCIVLAYYSSDISHIAAKVEDSDYSLCNLVYMHSYLSREQWCIIAQRITNFGEVQCKHIMHKLYLQKLKAMHTFRATCYAETKQSFIKDDTLTAEDSWKALLQEPFFLNNVLPEMDHQSILSAAEFIFKTCLAEDNNLAQNQSLINCDMLTRGVLYHTLQKISKLFKHKQRCSEKSNVIFVQEVFTKIDADLFICGNEMSEVHENFIRDLKLDWDTTTYKLDAEKLYLYLNLLKQMPILHMPAAVQEVLLVFLVALLHDCKDVIQKQHIGENVELTVSGLIYHNPGTLPKILPFSILLSKVMPLFHNWETIFINCLQWTIKNFDTFQNLQDGIDYILNLDKHNFLKHAVAFLNVTNEQTKKARLCQESKKLLTQYKLQISEKIVSVLDNTDLNGNLEAYALALKFYLSQDKPKSLQKIEDMLISYVEYAVTNLLNDHLLLLVTVLHNKSCLKEAEESLSFKIWQIAKQGMVRDVSDSKNHIQLYMLVFGHVNDEEFALITNDVFEITKKALQREEVEKYLYYLEIWSSVLTCCFKPTKTKLWQSILDKLLKEQREYLAHNSNAPISVIEETGKFQQKIIQAIQVPLTATMIDSILLTPSTLLNGTNEKFSALFSLGISIMEFMLKQRNSLIMDRLPVYLQQYRYLLEQLCVHGNCDLNLAMNGAQILGDCAHMLEKLTNMLIQNRKHVTRVVPYLIAYFLNIFEQFSLPSNIRVHLNNCFYSLLSLCDQHAISFLMRVLSTASTEMFKIMFEHYKKHYRFTGKV